MSPKSVFTCVLLVSVMVSCSTDPLKVDVSGIKTGIAFVNLDSLMVHTAPNDLAALNRKCVAELGDIYAYEIGYCIKLPNNSDTAFMTGMGLFMSDPYVQKLERRIGERFAELTNVQEEIDEGFKHLKVHFSKMKLPEKVVFMNSLFTSSVFSTEREIGVGLERYLGAETDVVKQLSFQSFPEWEKKAMNATFMSRDVLTSWITTHLVEEADGNLAEKIVRWGKALYATQAAFPDKDPAFVLRYEPKQYEWAVENEQALWKYLVDQDMLFKIDELNTKNLLSEGPFTPGLPEKGPDRLGQFLGYRIILKYMEIRGVTLEELMKTSYSDILVEYEID
jgi:hypothetical protein